MYRHLCSHYLYIEGIYIDTDIVHLSLYHSANHIAVVNSDSSLIQSTKIYNAIGGKTVQAHEFRVITIYNLYVSTC